jgi:hypothetical protein
MTPIEEAAMRAVIAKVTEDAMNEGILAAVEMIRVSTKQFPDLSKLQLANAIEATVTKDKTSP